MTIYLESKHTKQQENYVHVDLPIQPNTARTGLDIISWADLIDYGTIYDFGVVEEKKTIQNKYELLIDAIDANFKYLYEQIEDIRNNQQVQPVQQDTTIRIEANGNNSYTAYATNQQGSIEWVLETTGTDTQKPYYLNTSSGANVQLLESNIINSDTGNPKTSVISNPESNSGNFDISLIPNLGNALVYNFKLTAINNGVQAVYWPPQKTIAAPTITSYRWSCDNSIITFANPTASNTRVSYYNSSESNVQIQINCIVTYSNGTSRTISAPLFYVPGVRTTSVGITQNGNTYTANVTNGSGSTTWELRRISGYDSQQPWVLSSSTGSQITVNEQPITISNTNYGTYNISNIGDKTNNSGTFQATCTGTPGSGISYNYIYNLIAKNNNVSSSPMQLTKSGTTNAPSITSYLWSVNSAGSNVITINQPTVASPMITYSNNTSSQVSGIILSCKITYSDGYSTTLASSSFSIAGQSTLESLTIRRDASDTNLYYADTTVLNNASTSWSIIDKSPSNLGISLSNSVGNSTYVNGIDSVSNTNYGNPYINDINVNSYNQTITASLGGTTGSSMTIQYTIHAVNGTKAADYPEIRTIGAPTITGYNWTIVDNSGVSGGIIAFTGAGQNKVASPTLEINNTTTNTINVTLKCRITYGDNHYIIVSKSISVPGQTPAPSSINYLYMGTTKPTSLSEARVVDYYASEYTYTNESGAKSHIFVLTNSDKNVTFINIASSMPVSQTAVDTTTISGYKIFETAVGTANTGSIIIRIS